MTSVTGSHLKIAGFPPAACGEREVQTSFVCPQVLQMYLPFCGIAISNAQLFAASRKEYDRSRVRVVQQNAAPHTHTHPPTPVLTPWLGICQRHLLLPGITEQGCVDTSSGLATRRPVHGPSLWGTLKKHMSNTDPWWKRTYRDHSSLTEGNEESSLYAIWVLRACILD